MRHPRRQAATTGLTAPRVTGRTSKARPSLAPSLDTSASWGYEARARSNADSEVLHLPLTLLTGLGELSRIGEVVLNPYLGQRFKTAVITTSLPMAVDKSIDFGLQDFCNKCKKCAREGTPGAISFSDKVMFNGYEMWKPDVESCTRYRVTNPAVSGCGRCLKVCPFNKQGLFEHRIPL